MKQFKLPIKLTKDEHLGILSTLAVLSTARLVIEAWWCRFDWFPLVAIDIVSDIDF